MKKIIFHKTIIFTVILAGVLGHHCEGRKSFRYSDKWETTKMGTLQAVDKYIYMGFMVGVMGHHKQENTTHGNTLEVGLWKNDFQFGTRARTSLTRPVC
jgi:hypothetical protein